MTDELRAAAGRWQPIETADKGAGRVLVWADGPRFAGFGRSASGNREGWFDSETGFMIFPTHWTPLPSPPKEAAP